MSGADDSVDGFGFGGYRDIIAGGARTGRTGRKRLALCLVVVVGKVAGKVTACNVSAQLLSWD